MKLRLVWAILPTVLFITPGTVRGVSQGPHSADLNWHRSAELKSDLETAINLGDSYIVPELPGFLPEIDVDTDPDCASGNCDWDDLDVDEKLSFAAAASPTFSGYLAISHTSDRLYIYVQVNDTDTDPNSADNLILMFDTGHDHVLGSSLDRGIQFFRNGTVGLVTGDPVSPTPDTPLFSSGETAFPACAVRICIRSLGAAGWRLEGWAEPSDFGLPTFSGTHGALIVAEDEGSSPADFCDGTAGDSDRSCWPNTVDVNYWNHLRLDLPELVLLFDVSGSMSWSAEGDPNVPVMEQRLQRAKDASKPFIENMNAQYAARAKFGIAQFPRQPWSPPQCLGQVVTSMTLLNSASASAATDPGGTIDGLNASGNTPLLAGVEAAAAMFEGEGERVIVLLSDGYHNCPIAADPDPTIATVSAVPASVYTLGYGRPSDIDYPLLEQLANELGGTFYDVTGTTDEPTLLAAAYKQVLVTALGLEEADDPRGTIAAGETDSAEVALNEFDRRITIHLSWATHQLGRLGLHVTSADGRPVPLDHPAVSIRQGATYTILTIGLPFLQLPDKIGPHPWLLEISADSLRGTEIETYLYGVNLNSGLKFRTDLDRIEYFTGDIVTMTASVTTPAGAIRGLDEIYVDVIAPGDGAGNWFAENLVTPGELNQIPDSLSNESLPPVLRKSIFLTDVRNMPFPANLGLRRIKLFDDGTHGDRLAGDGEYVNRFQVLKEGTHSFRFHAAGGTERETRFQRERRIDEYVQVGVSAPASLIDVVSAGDGEGGSKKFDIVLTFKDPLGNFLGPRYSRDIRLSSSHGRLVSGVRDNLDGSYTQSLLLPPGVSPDEVHIVGVIRGVRIGFNVGERMRPQFRAGLAAGATLPTGSFNDTYDPGYRIEASLGYRIGQPLFLIAYGGYNWFSSGQSGVSDTHVWNLSVNLQASFRGRIRPFVEAGSGVYFPSGDSARIGFNSNAGITFSIARRWDAYLSGGYHQYFLTGSDGQFIALQAGVIANW